jgi:hypothetical protein
MTWVLIWDKKTERKKINPVRGEKWGTLQE